MIFTKDNNLEILCRRIIIFVLAVFNSSFGIVVILGEVSRITRLFQLIAILCMNIAFYVLMCIWLWMYSNWINMSILLSYWIIIPNTTIYVILCFVVGVLDPKSYRYLNKEETIKEVIGSDWRNSITPQNLSKLYKAQHCSYQWGYGIWGWICGFLTLTHLITCCLYFKLFQNICKDYTIWKSLRFGMVLLFLPFVYFMYTIFQHNVISTYLVPSQRPISYVFEETNKSFPNHFDSSHWSCESGNLKIFRENKSWFKDITNITQTDRKSNKLPPAYQNWYSGHVNTVASFAWFSFVLFFWWVAIKFGIFDNNNDDESFSKTIFNSAIANLIWGVYLFLQFVYFIVCTIKTGLKRVHGLAHSKSAVICGALAPILPVFSFLLFPMLLQIIKIHNQSQTTEDDLTQIASKSNQTEHDS